MAARLRGPIVTMPVTSTSPIRGSRILRAISEGAVVLSTARAPYLSFVLVGREFLSFQ